MDYISYLTSCLKNDKIVRWPDHTMPLTIYIAPFRWYKAKGEEHLYYGMIEDALNVWQIASEGKISFQIVQNLYDSQINIEWKRVERESLGHCYFNYDGQGRLFSAEVHIGLSDGVLHQQYMDKNEVAHTIVHEIGHALGLLHSPFKDDIMYVPHQYGVTSISHRDINTIKWLYNFPNNSTVQEILAKHGVSANHNLDQLIYMLENKGKVPELMPEQQAPSSQNDEQLKKEQITLAKLNKFNMSIQNVNLSNDAQEYFKKLKMKKGFWNNK